MTRTPWSAPIIVILTTLAIPVSGCQEPVGTVAALPDWSTPSGFGLESLFDSEDEAMIRVASFNAWGVPDLPVADLTPARDRRMRRLCDLLAETAEKEAGWDIVFLQEVWVNGDRDRVGRCGYDHVVEMDDRTREVPGPMRIFQESADSNLDTGLMILSRYPVLAAEKLQFRSRPEGDYAGESYPVKGAYFALVALPGGERAWFVNTHVVTVVRTGFDPYEETRKAQMREIAARLREVNADGLPAVVGGDFNLDPRDPSWDETLAALPGLESPFSFSPFERSYLGPEIQNGRIDHLRFSSHWTAVVGRLSPELTTLSPGSPCDGARALTDPCMLSDHVGIEATARLGSGG